MNKWVFGTVAAAAIAVSAPAAAITVLTFDFGGAPTGIFDSVSVLNGNVTLTATARKFQALPDSLTLLSDTQAIGQVRRSAPGIGVSGGATGFQVDTNLSDTSVPQGFREAMLISGSSSFSLQGLKLSFVDNNDTLQVYGVQGNGTLVNLGYPGVIRAGVTGPNASTSLLNGLATGPAFDSLTNLGTQSLTLVNPTAFFSGYLFTTRVAGATGLNQGQGYRIDSLVVGVPEPESWALLIVGFGIVGVTARRRRTAVAA